MSDYTCQICGTAKISPKVYEKLDELADDNDVIVCLNCYAAVDGQHVMIPKAETRTAKLVRLIQL